MRSTGLWRPRPSASITHTVLSRNEAGLLIEANSSNSNLSKPTRKDELAFLSALCQLSQFPQQVLLDRLVSTGHGPAVFGGERAAVVAQRDRTIYREK